VQLTVDQPDAAWMLDAERNRMDLSSAFVLTIYSRRDRMVLAPLCRSVIIINSHIILISGAPSNFVISRSFEKIQNFLAERYCIRSLIQQPKWKVHREKGKPSLTFR